MYHRSPLCERARLWASLRPDGELSELESALLDAHLARCAQCRTFAGGVEEVARGLRRVRLERPAPVVVPARRLRPAARGLRAAAAAVAVVAVGAAAALTGASASGPAATKPVAMVAAVESPDGLRQLRRADLIQRGRQAVHPRLRRELAEPV